MSIAITGPARYLYQDKVILEQVLRFWARGISCVYEPKNGEDATVRFGDGANTTEIEIQVKGAEALKAALTLKQLAEYLAHFPEHSDKSSLIQRLCADSNKQVLLVCAQRATDECAALTKLRQWAGEPHDQNPALSSLASGLSSEFRTFKNGIKVAGVEARRVSAMREFSTKINNRDLREGLRRLIVLDQWNEEYVEDCIRRHLTEEHAIPGDVIEDVSNRLLSALRSGAGTGSDVIPIIASILEEASSLSIRPLDYVARGEEEGWKQTLSKERVLLLSGPPRCGKSEAACWIAADYEKSGFSVYLCYSVEEAERLVRDPSRAHIVVVLDDPLGVGVDNVANAFRSYASLSRLLGRVPVNRRLIVAQSQEPLLASVRVSTLDQAITSNRKWYDLSIYPSSFLEKVWLISALKNAVSQQISDLVASSLANAELVLGPGVLSHLAANASRLSPESTLAQVKTLAAESAHDFAISLCTTADSKKLIRALAVGSSEREALAETELAFMLGRGGEPKLPAFPGMMYGFGAMDEEELQLPRYDENPSLSSHEVNEIANLQHHSIIAEHRMVGFRFTHPFYRAAARSVIARSASVERKDLLLLINRALLSLSPSCSAAAARNLGWLYQDLELTVGLGEEIVKAAEQALRWYFPETRDLCYEFLVNVLEREPAKYSEKVGHWISVALSYGIEDIQWDANIPFIPEGMEQPWIASRDFDAPITDDIAVWLASLRGGEALPEGRQAVAVIKHFAYRPEELDEIIVGRLLSYAAGVLRASIAAIWVSIERKNDTELLRRISYDTHPKVVANTVKSILVAWPNYSEFRKRSLVELADPWCQRPETAAAVLKELFAYFYKGEDWYDEDGSASTKPWELFAELFPKAIQRFPISFWLSDAKIYSVCEDALQNLPSKLAYDVALAWVNMIGRKIDEEILPSDFELGVISSVLQSAAIDDDQRHRILELAMSTLSTGAVLVFVADAIDDWDGVPSSSKDLITKKIASDSPDAIWLRASVLTRAEVPLMIEQLILGFETSLSMAPSELVASISPELLDACIKVYRGEPQPLWYLGKHHSRSQIWKAIVQYLGSVPGHNLFQDCIAELIAFDEDALLEVVRKLDAESREAVFNLVIEAKVGVVGDWHRKVVDSLLESAADNKVLERMQKKMTDRAFAVLESVSDIFAWTNHVATQKALLMSVEGDAVARKNINTVWEILSNDESRAKKAFSNLLDVANVKKPLLHQTYSEILALARRVGASSDVLEKSEKNRLLTLEMHHVAKEMLKPATRYSRLKNWFGPG